METKTYKYVKHLRNDNCLTLNDEYLIHDYGSDRYVNVYSKNTYVEYNTIKNVKLGAVSKSVLGEYFEEVGE